jgi:hypothetical protein
VSRRPARFTEAELKRVKKVSGKEVAVEILLDGTIRLTPVPEPALTAQNDAGFAPRKRIVL